MVEAYIAKIAESLDSEDCVKVIFLGGSPLEHKVRVLHNRANPLYGVSGNLPDIGEIGIVLKIPAYGEEYFWLGSYHSLVENICTTETGKTIEHHDSGVWKKIDKDGNIELSHPSGSYLKMGDNTVLSSRTRYKRKAGTHNLKESVAYDLCQQQPINLFLKHIWALAPLTEGGCINDNRKKAYSGATKSTTIQISDDGIITLTHETVSGTNVLITIDSSGNIVITSPEKTTIDVGNDIMVKSATRVDLDAPEIKSTATTIVEATAPSIKSEATTLIELLCNLVNVGAVSGHKALATDDIINIFNNHTHPGDSGGTTGVPNTTISSTNMTTNLKAT